MGQLVRPRVFLTGFTEVHEPGLKEYLEYTKQTEFWETYQQAREEGISGGEILCSFYAKLCYKSLVLGKNANVRKVRDVQKNLEGCHDSGHGSVFEHCGINFVVTDCSRVYTHEQVRHRPGCAYSQTSGRYCRLDSIDLVWDPILDPVKDLFLGCVRQIEDTVYLAECKLGLRKPPLKYPGVPANTVLGPAHRMYTEIAKVDGTYNQFEDLNDTRDRLRWIPDDSFDFDKRKKITSAIRRIAPNGQSNEIGMTCNVRALRHVVQLRTARFAETEIRDVWGQIYHLVAARFPTIFYKARTRVVDDFTVVYGMKSSPYDIEAGDPKALEFWTTESLRAELDARQAA